MSAVQTRGLAATRCRKIMCSQELRTKKNAAKWLLAHHPDQGGQAASVPVGDVATCMGKRFFCSDSPPPKAKAGSERAASGRAASGHAATAPAGLLRRTTSGRPASVHAASAPAAVAAATAPTADPNAVVNDEMYSIGQVFERVKIKTPTASAAAAAAGQGTPATAAPAYQPSDRQLQCVRQVSNWSKITPKNRFNKSRFSVADTDKLIPIASPKLEAMLQNIAALDAQDQTVFGKNFKHFIFSDVKFLGYGAKIITAAMIARGFTPILKNEKSKIVVDVPKPAKGKGKDSRNGGKNFAVLCSTAMWDRPFKHALKKEVLGIYNKRPDNIHGENCRFIILDSGFKEGIDLFDVKYVHLYEPLMTQADMTQALGRATRLCGQKGLDFLPNQGWPLHVFRYSQSIPEQLQPFYKAKTLFEIALQLKGLDSRLGSVSKAINDVSILAAVDQPLTDEIHKSGMLPKISIRTSRASASAAKGPEDRLVVLDLQTTQNSINVRNERSRANLVSADKRLAYSQQLMLENAHSMADSLAAIADEDGVASDPCSPKVPSGCHELAIVPFQPSRLRSETITPTVVMESNLLVVRQPSEAAAEAEAEAASAKKRKTLPKTWFGLRHYVVDVFDEYKWPPQVVENRCVAPAKGGARPAAAAGVTKGRKVAAPAKGTRKAAAAAAAAVPAVEFKAPAAKVVLPALNLVNYTPTQAFISQYFTVDNPVRGMLLWHSVGTGKTCTAIALASTQFEAAGYTIMWVTRHTLKADIWKNIFDQVCHSTIANEVRRGELTPAGAEARKRALYANWIPPVSYRQFSNIVQGKNPIYKMLQQRNGKADPLRKTLIIIDEAHKLYSSDFKGAEKPDVPAFMAALQNSYSTSGDDSARVLLMTATPYNESPMELMMLLNLCRPKATWLPTEMPAFIAKYMDAAGRFTKTGLKAYMDDIAGQISYLNREADPSQFAQPIFADVVVPISTFADVGEGDDTGLLEMRKDLVDLKAEKATLIEQTIPYLEAEVGRIGPALDAQLAECDSTFAGRPKDIKACQARVTKRYKDGLKLEERNLREARVRADKIDKEYEKLEGRIRRATVKQRKTGPGALSQQAQLESRCKIGIQV